MKMRESEGEEGEKGKEEEVVVVVVVVVEEEGGERLASNK